MSVRLTQQAPSFRMSKEDDLTFNQGMGFRDSPKALNDLAPLGGVFLYTEDVESSILFARTVAVV